MPTAHEVLTGIAKYSAIGVAFTLGEPLTVTGVLLSGVAGNTLTDGLNQICNRLTASGEDNHDVKKAFAEAVRRASREAARGDMLMAYQLEHSRVYERLSPEDQAALDTFCRNLERAHKTWTAAEYITQGFDEATVQTLAHLGPEKAKAEIDRILGETTLADLPNHFALYFARHVRSRVTFHFWERLKDPKTGTQPWRVFVRNSLRDLQGALQRVGDDHQVMMDLLKSFQTDPKMDRWVEQQASWLEQRGSWADQIAEQVTARLAERMAPPPIRPPYQLPPLAATLEGREEELDELLHLLRTHPRVALVGEGGVGKTALAAAALHQLAPGSGAERFAFYEGGILSHDFYVQRTLEAVLRTWYLDFAADPTQVPDPDQVRHVVEHGLKRLNPLVYLEGAENAADLPALLELLQRTGCRVLLTTRDDRQVRRWKTQRLDTLAPDAARRVYAYHAELTTYHEGVLDALCAQLGRLPLPLETLGASNKGLRPDTVAAAYTFEALEDLTADERGRRRMGTIVERALERGGAHAQRVFSVLGWFANAPIPLNLLTAAAGLEEPEVQRALQVLYSLHLVRFVQPGPDAPDPDTRWQGRHDLIYQVARQRAARDGVVAYLKYTDTWITQREQEAWLPGGYRSLDAVMPHIEQVCELAEQALGAKHPSTAGSLNNLAHLYQSQGRYAEAEPLYKQALAVREQVLGEEHPSTATSLNNLAHLYQSQGRYAEAESLYKQALAVREQVLGE
ncbi:MAG: tetratricopeptide repeat protein, partial [Bacteroidota bacterium]